jgi:hypothetical protein
VGAAVIDSSPRDPASPIASTLVVLAIALPWLTLLPLHGAAAALAHAITLVAAYHGAGLVVARVAGQRLAPPVLVVAWGIAALIGLSGVAMVCHAGTLAIHAVLVFGFAAVHTGSLGLAFNQHVTRIDERLAGPRLWLYPAALLGVLGVLAVLGAAGDTPIQPFDDEGHVLAQLRRLLDTGMLGDPIGYPRRAQLGAQIALAAIASGAGDGFARIVEPLAQVLALGLAVSRIRARDASSALWAMLLVAAAFGLALVPNDPLPCWTAVVLIVALYTMLSEAAPAPLPLAITAGALLAVRYELAPVALVALFVAWWRRRDDHRATSILVGAAFAVAFPFLIARMVAWRSVSPLAHAALAPPAQAAFVLRVVLAAVLAVPAAGILRLVLPHSLGVRQAGLATAIALAAIAARATGAGAYSLRMAWPIALGFVITLVVELVRARASSTGALITAFVLCLLIYEGREAPGRLRWSRRLASAAENLEVLQHPPAEPADAYRVLLAGVPAGARVAVWVSEPERLDYARLNILDLRTPAGARLRAFRWDRHPAQLAPLLAALEVSYLLLERDDAHVQRTQSDLLFRFLCQAPAPAICADDLEAIAGAHPIIAQHANLALVALKP